MIIYVYIISLAYYFTNVFRPKWYKEVLIIAVILPAAGIVVALFIPIPYNWLFILVLYIVVIVSRIGKKALTVKEAILLVMIFYGVTKISSLFLPDYSYLAFSIPVTFLVIWLIHNKTTRTEQKAN